MNDSIGTESGINAFDHRICGASFYGAALDKIPPEEFGRKAALPDCGSHGGDVLNGWGRKRLFPGL